jgi:prepilin-type N-terminal cleavage/methylation domain-containing protein
MTSRQKLAQAGFTLVELAIVLLIVGLLISGILKGQELIQNSRMTATIQQVKAYEAAVNTFRDSFGGLPGDLVNAATRVPGCVAGVGCADGNGDGTIGLANQVGAAAPALNTERNQFWLHMALANLITGILPNYATNTVAAWGTTLPAGRASGGFMVGQANSTASILGSAGPLNGHYIVLQGSPAAAANAGFALDASRAAQMDLKLDDGQPGTGDVVAFGAAGAAGCYSLAGAAGVYSGAQGTTAVCSLGIRIMN